jgi:protein PsiE
VRHLRRRLARRTADAASADGECPARLRRQATLFKRGRVVAVAPFGYHPAMTQQGTRVSRGLIRFGTGTVQGLEVLGLILITIATVVAGAQEVVRMVSVMQVTLADLLLLFIYLEVLTMVGIYLESGALPVRMPLYIAIVALARHLILDMKSMTEWTLIASAAAIVLLAAAVLVIRYGHVRFPYDTAVPTDETKPGRE